MSFLDNAKKRYSVRDFKPVRVEKEKLSTILEAARVAPTGANKQPYRLIVVEKAEGLDKIKKATNIYGAPLAIIVCGDHKEAWKRPFDGKTLVDIDTSIVTDHMMLQATELGLGSVWICYFKPDVIKKEFELPDHLEPVHILTMGYENCEPLSKDRHDKTRRALREFVSYESLKLSI